MSKIFDLINELCPNGVEFRELGEIADIVRGVTYDKNLEINGEHEQGIKILRANNINLDFTLNFEDLKQIKELPCNSSQKNLMQKDILICVASGSKEHVGKVAYCFEDTDCFAGGFMSIIRAKQVINARFLFFIMSSSTFKVYLEKVLTSSTINNLNNTILKNFKLPVPPMEVQREIVRILDSFTLLTAELTAELTARKKQYEFYRDFLLNFNEGQSEIEWDIIDNIFIMKNGYTPSKANKDFWENGTISWYRMEDIRENGRILSESIQKITPQAVKGGKLIPKNSIIVATTATIGEHALAIADSFLMNQRFTSFTIRELLKDKLDIKFVFYYFFKICEWCKQNTNSSSFPSVDMAKLKKVKFPVPSPQTQQKVIEILDKFDTLVNSITEGLPREIELRHKQYEYYREKLLNFTELKKEI